MRSSWRRFLHALAHLVGAYDGYMVTISIDASATHWIGFQCLECGTISGLCEPFGCDWKASGKRPLWVQEKTAPRDKP